MLINSKDVLCVEGFNKDKYGRILATCYSNNKNINMQMVENGYAISYGHSIYKKFQKSACESNKNIWKGKMIIPQDYRKGRLEYKRFSCDQKI